MAANPSASASKPPDSQSQNIKQESKNDNDASSWNVVVSKRQHAPSTPGPNNNNKSKQQYPKPKAGGPHNNKQQQRQQKQQHLSQQRANNNNNNNNNRNSSSNNSKNNPNNRKPQHQKNIPNENAKKKGKPKPTAMTVGDMLPLVKRKKIHKDTGRQQQQQSQSQQSQSQPAKIKPERSSPRQPQPPQNYPNLRTDSVQDFPALGATSGPSVPPPHPSSGPKKGWGSLPKPPPPPPTDTFRTEPNRSNPSTNSSSSRAAAAVSAPPLSRSSPPWKVKTPDPRAAPFVATAQPHKPTKVLKRGEALPSAKNAAASAAPNKKKKAKPSTHSASKPAQVPTPSSAASFFQPRPRDPPAVSQQLGTSGRELVGEEHQLLRLVQERNVYQKKGRQRVAPRKKKFTALKKKVLQERLDQWRALHPEEVPAETAASTHPAATTHPQNAFGSGSRQGFVRTRSLCLYNYAEPDELQDEDEYEEILENLTSMATKIGPIEEVFLPRSRIPETTDEPSRASAGETVSDKDTPYRHPVFVLFQKESDASAALACWSDWVIGGSKLEVVGLEMDESTESSAAWSERALAAESKRRNDPGNATPLGNLRTMEILLQKVLTEEDYDDEDCMNESLADLKQIALRFGAVGTIRAAGANGDVLVTYENTSLEDSRGIAQDLCRVVVGGQPLYASVCEPPNEPAGSSTTSSSTLLLENVLTEDDLQDSDCLQESLNDIKELCLRYGTVSDVVAKGSAVKVTYRDKGDNTTIAETAARELNGIILGGNTVTASVLTSTDGENNPLDYSLDLYNIITEEDLEDEDCMEESLGDVQRLASNYGEVVSVKLCKAEDDSSNDPSKAKVRIQFGANDPSVVAKALEGFSGMVIGGQIISASLSASGSATPEASENTNPGDKRKPIDTPQSTIASNDSDNIKKARTDDKAPLYSGDKLISERFAVMKRVPKIPNKQGPRAYASGAPTDERIKPLLTEMLGELMRLQKRAVEDKNAKARRRMVMGLREVARGIRAHKVKMVVMANNLDQYGVIDEKLQEIIDLAKSEGVPLFFEFTKRSLGKAIGKSIKIAVVGIQNADGAHQPFKKLNAIASRM